jgi:single-strand DNA-binding protein
MFNTIILAGNITRDIELKYSSSGTAIARTTIATTRKYTINGERKEDTCFVDITFFGRSAEIANQYLQKGSKILVEGRLSFDQWTDQNGQKRSKHSVTVETMQMLGSKQDANKQEYSSEQSHTPDQAKQYDHTAYQPRQERQRAVPDQNALPLDINEDEIPF